MFTKISLALAGLLTVATATLPAHLVISVVEISTGTTIGSLNGYGNFSSPGPDYPFAAYASTGNDSTLSGYGTCTVGSILACYQTTGTAAEFFVSSAITVRRLIMLICIRTWTEKLH